VKNINIWHTKVAELTKPPTAEIKNSERAFDDDHAFDLIATEEDTFSFIASEKPKLF